MEVGLTVILVTGSEALKSESFSLLRPPNWTGTCSGAMYLGRMKQVSCGKRGRMQEIMLLHALEESFRGFRRPGKHKLALGSLRQKGADHPVVGEVPPRHVNEDLDG